MFKLPKLGKKGMTGPVQALISWAVGLGVFFFVIVALTGAMEGMRKSYTPGSLAEGAANTSLTNYGTFNTQSGNIITIVIVGIILTVLFGALGMFLYSRQE